MIVPFEQVALTEQEPQYHMSNKVSVGSDAGKLLASTDTPGRDEPSESRSRHKSGEKQGIVERLKWQEAIQIYSG